MELDGDDKSNKLLPDHVQEKLSLLKKMDSLNFEEQTELLSYFIDRFKNEVLDYLRDEDLLTRMNDFERKRFIDRLTEG